MDLKQLEYFVRVAELASFTKAAQQMHIAQPALSRQVRLLEVELRQNLLTRNGRGAIVTEAGKLLLEHSRGILHQVQRAQEELGRIRGGLSGRVAVGMPTSVARALAVPLIREFRSKMPQATVSLQEGLSSAMLDGLTAGRLDIALLYNAVPQAEVELTSLLDEALYLVQPATIPAHLPRPVQSDSALLKKKSKAAQNSRAPQPLALKDLASLPLVIPSRPNAIRKLVEDCLSAVNLSPTISLEIDGVGAILELVADGAGYAVLPQSTVSTWAAMKELPQRPIEGMVSRLSMAISSQRPSTLTQQGMQALIAQRVKGLLQN